MKNFIVSYMNNTTHLLIVADDITHEDGVYYIKNMKNKINGVGITELADGYIDSIIEYKEIRAI